MRIHRFLIIDDNADGRYLLTKTLLRKFPQAVIQECQDADAAVSIATDKKIEAIIAHRAADIDGLELIRLLREANPTVPIVMVSGVNRTTEANAAGATHFLNYDEWLRIGTMVESALSESEALEGKGKSQDWAEG